MSNLKKYMFRGCAFGAISLVIGMSLYSAKGVKGESINRNIEYSKSETPKVNTNQNNNYTVSMMNQLTVKEEKQKLLPYGQVVDVESNLCVRETPDINSGAITVLMNGMTFEILSKTNEWYEIKYNDIQGFVHEDYVEEYENTPPNEVYEENTTFKRAIKAELTAYCDDPRCSDGWGSKTAMETHTRIGVIAAPKDIPLGSKIYIPELTNLKSDGIFDVEDRGGAIKVKEDGTYVIDVWVPSYEEAIAFGRKEATIYLME